MNTSEYIIKKLEELGITDFFGVPGDYNFNILNAIQSNQKTRFVGCTNELNASYAADGYAREKGYGALITTYGVGELSAINGIAGSFAENVPVINIVGVPSTNCLESKSLVHHSLNNSEPKTYENVFKNVTSATAFLNKYNAKIEIDRVLQIFIKEKRPVYIAVPVDIAKTIISDREVNYSWVSNLETLDKVTELICEKINHSENPVILSDILIKRFEAQYEFKEFVEKSGIPVTNFVMGKGLVNYDYAKYLGTYFGKYKNPVAKKYLETTDCLIAVGTIYSDFNSSGFNLPYKINTQIAIYGTYTYINGTKYDNIKMKDVLDNLIKKIHPKEINFDKPEIGYEKTNKPNGDLTSDYVYSRIQEFLSENDIVVGETGLAQYGLAQMKLPLNTEIHLQGLWGSIGWATPATLGICLAEPSRKVILVTGEGAHQMSALEVGNMVKQGVKPVIIVLNNNGYGIEKLLSDSDNSYNEVININYSRFIRSFDGDVWTTKVSTQDDFDKALRVTQIMDKLCYIEVCLDSNDSPDLGQMIMSEIKKTADYNTESIPETCCAIKAKDINKILNKEAFVNKDDFDFGTTVHESLKDL